MVLFHVLLGRWYKIFRLILFAPLADGTTARTYPAGLGMLRNPLGYDLHAISKLFILAITQTLQFLISLLLLLLAVGKHGKPPTLLEMCRQYRSVQLWCWCLLGTIFLSLF